jgi:hypothetical protein
MSTIALHPEMSMSPLKGLSRGTMAAYLTSKRMEKITGN